MKAAIDQISWSGTPTAPKLGIAVMLMPFLTTQNKCSGSRSFASSLRSGGSGRNPSENFAQLTPGAPWQLIQPRSEKARAPACTTAGSSSDIGGLSFACRAIEAVRTWTNNHFTGAASSIVADTL